MKKFRTLFIILYCVILTFIMLTSCSNKVTPDKKVHYIDLDCVIMDKMLNIPLGRDGSHAFLIRSVKDTTLYCEYTSIGCTCHMSDSMFYTHYIGDTLHFDYIAKKRFFKRK